MMGSLEEVKDDLKRYRRELYEIKFRKGELKSLIDKALDQEWRLEKELNPHMVACMSCKRRRALVLCKACNLRFCCNCVEERDDSDCMLTYICGICARIAYGMYTLYIN